MSATIAALMGTTGCSFEAPVVSVPAARLDTGAASPLDASAGDGGAGLDAAADAGGREDAGWPDLGSPDTGSVDSGLVDVGASDVGLVDAGAPDVGLVDAGASDVGLVDAGAPDIGASDAESPDTGLPDAGSPDTGLPDAGPPDIGAPDIGLPDAGSPDTGPPDTGPPDTGPPPPVCGNGLIEGSEGCDDQNFGDSDGCSGVCVIETGWTCSGEPSVCVCPVDADQDGIVDCIDGCIDLDGDGFGQPGPYANACLGLDCDETRVECTELCADCLPSILVLNAESPVGLCAPSTLDIELDRYTGAAGDISCTAPRQTLFREDFEGGRGLFGDQTDPTEVELRSWRDSFPLSCPSSGGFIRFDGDDPEAWSQLSTPIDATGYRDLVLSLTAAFRLSTDAGEDLEVHTCCGAGCVPTLLGVIENGSSGGTDDCASYSFQLPPDTDECPALMVRILFRDSGGERAAFDDVALTGELIFAPVSELGSGAYQSSIFSCAPTSAQVTCTWDDGTNPPLSDSDTASFQ